MVTTNPGTYIPTGYESDLRQIDRKRQIADALRAQSLTVDGGPQSYISPFVKIAQALIGKSAYKEADALQQNVDINKTIRHNTDTISLQNDMATLSPQQLWAKWGSTLDPVLQAQLKPYADAAAEGLKNAVTYKGNITTRGPNNELITNAIMGDGRVRSDFLPPGTVEAANLDYRGQVYNDPRTGKPIQQGPADPDAVAIRDTPEPGQVVGPIVPNPAAIQGKGMVAAAGRPVTNNMFNISTMDKLGELLPKAQVDGLTTGQQIAGDYIKSLPSMSRIENILKSGKMYTGAAAKLQLDAARFADFAGLGGKDEREKIANTQAYIRETGQRLFPILQALRPASDTDVKTAERMSAGDITLSPAEMWSALQAAKQDGNNTLRSHNAKVQRYSDLYRGRSPDAAASIETFRVDMPGAGGKKGGPMSLDDYLNTHGPK